jgi:transposase
MSYNTFSRPVQKLRSEVIGLDVHKQSIVYCRLDRRGAVIAEDRIPADRDCLARLLDRQVGRRSTHLTLEASGCFLWVYDLLVERHGKPRVHVAQSRSIRMIAESKRKTDRTDAFWLAYFTREGTLPQCWIPCGARRELRAAARFRHDAVRDRTACVNRLKGIFAQLGIAMRGAGLRSIESRRHAHERAQSIDGVLGRALRHYLTQLDQLDETIAAWDEELAQLSRGLPDVATLEREIPGIGLVLAALVAGEAGDLRRFASAKAFAAYTGLVPGCRMSAGKYAATNISREGSSLLRYALTQAVLACTRARRGDAFVVGDWVRRKEARMGAKGRARCAAARKLAETIWRLFHYGECFDAAKAFGGRSRAVA